MIAVEAARRLARTPDRQAPPVPKKHRLRNLGLATVAVAGGLYAANHTSIGSSIEHGVEKYVTGEIDKGLKAFGGFLVHLADGKNVPPHAVSTVDQQASTFSDVIYVTGGKISGYVDSYAEHGHRLGGETFHKLLPFDALVGGNAGQVAEKVKLDWDYKTTTYSNGQVKTKKTLKEVEVPLPQPEIISPRLLFDTPAMYAKLRAGMSPRQINNAIKQYKDKTAYAKAHNGQGEPVPDDGISMHRSAWFGGLTGDITNTDAEVPQLGYTTAQIAIALDAFNPYDPRVQKLIKQTDSGLLQYVKGNYPSVPVVAEPATKQSITQTIEQRYLEEEPYLSGLPSAAYFSVAPSKSKAPTPEPLEFNMQLPSGPHSQVTFSDVMMTPTQATTLNHDLGLTVPKQ